jgi:hypothetical protein
MLRRTRSWAISLLMLVLLCNAVALLLAVIIVGVADIRDEQAQGLVFGAIFIIALIFGLIRFPLAKRS